MRAGEGEGKGAGIMCEGMTLRMGVYKFKKSNGEKDREGAGNENSDAVIVSKGN